MAFHKSWENFEFNEKFVGCLVKYIGSDTYESDIPKNLIDNCGVILKESPYKSSMMPDGYEIYMGERKFIVAIGKEIYKVNGIQLGTFFELISFQSEKQK